MAVRKDGQHCTQQHRILTHHSLFYFVHYFADARHIRTSPLPIFYILS